MARREVEPQTELGRQLEKERNNRGLTKTDWVVALDTSVPTYLNWLRSSVEIQRVNVVRIGEVLGVETDDVYGWVYRENSGFHATIRPIGLLTQPDPQLALAS